MYLSRPVCRPSQCIKVDGSWPFPGSWLEPDEVSKVGVSETEGSTISVWMWAVRPRLLCVLPDPACPSAITRSRTCASGIKPVVVTYGCLLHIGWLAASRQRQRRLHGCTPPLTGLTVQGGAPEPDRSHQGLHGALLGAAGCTAKRGVKRPPTFLPGR